MEEIIKHIDMEMLKSYSYQGSYTDEYLFFTDKLENIFQENKNVKLEFFLMIYCIEGEIKLELNNKQSTPPASERSDYQPSQYDYRSSTR